MNYKAWHQYALRVLPFMKVKEAEGLPLVRGNLGKN
jgi:hypothetical protein